MSYNEKNNSQGHTPAPKRPVFASRYFKWKIRKRKNRKSANPVL